MAAKISSVKKTKPTGYLSLLSSAPCEWFLIFLLFIYAALTYFLAKFARFCELETPCLLCTRIDHIFGQKKSDCLLSLLCSSHREEISTLVCCSIHDKLADVNGMCEECFLPIAAGNKSSSGSYRLLVGKLWVDVERSALQNMMLNKHIRRHFLGHRTCSCCNKTFRIKSNGERLLELSTSAGFGASKANVKPPLPRVLTRSRFSKRESLKRLRDKFTETMSQVSAVSNSSDTLPHVGYTKLKISSESESEVISTEDDDGFPGTRSKTGSEPKYDVWYDRQGIPRPQGDKFVSELKSDQGYELKPLVLDIPNLLDLSKNKNADFRSSDTRGEQDPRELNWAEYYHKPSKCLTEEIDARRGSFSTSAESSNSIHSSPRALALPILSDMSKATTLSSTMTIPKQHTKAVGETSTDAVHSWELDDMNPTEGSTQNVEKRELSSIHVVERASAQNEEEIESSLKALATSEVGSSLTSPSTSDKHDKFRAQEIPVSASPETNDSGHHESSDGISDCDIVGEGIVDRLKRQVEHDQSCITSLHQELEAERSAVTIAANQAMAMITRLQDEKAALRMEALQYLRLMEEQAEYDREALERANDLLSEKEKELQDMEIELEFYRDNIVEESMFVHQTENSLGVSTSYSKPSNVTISNGNFKPMSNSAPIFEDEIPYIPQCLNKMEKRIDQAYCGRKLDGMSTGVDSRNMKNEVSNTENLPHKQEETTLVVKMEDRNSPLQNRISASNANYYEINSSAFEDYRSS